MFGSSRLDIFIQLSTVVEQQQHLHQRQEYPQQALYMSSDSLGSPGLNTSSLTALPSAQDPLFIQNSLQSTPSHTNRAGTHSRFSPRARHNTDLQDQPYGEREGGQIRFRSAPAPLSDIFPTPRQYWEHSVEQQAPWLFDDNPNATTGYSGTFSFGEPRTLTIETTGKSPESSLSGSENMDDTIHVNSTAHIQGNVIPLHAQNNLSNFEYPFQPMVNTPVLYSGVTKRNVPVHQLPFLDELQMPATVAKDRQLSPYAEAWSWPKQEKQPEELMLMFEETPAKYQIEYMQNPTVSNLMQAVTHVPANVLNQLDPNCSDLNQSQTHMFDALPISFKADPGSKSPLFQQQDHQKQILPGQACAGNPALAAFEEEDWNCYMNLSFTEEDT
jgi:hypothetical protein